MNELLAKILGGLGMGQKGAPAQDLFTQTLNNRMQQAGEAPGQLYRGNGAAQPPQMPASQPPVNFMKGFSDQEKAAQQAALAKILMQRQMQK